MTQEEQHIIEVFLNKADPKIAKHNQKFFKQGEDSYCKNDLLLGIPMPVIKDFVTNTPTLQLETIANLIKSEFNEVRVLGWALLFRDYHDTYTIKIFVKDYSQYCGNWNVVDFAAPLASKILMKQEGHKSTESVAYDLLYREINLWTHRFALIMSLPLVKESHLNYAVDVTERSLEFEDEMIQKACGAILREVGKQNRNILKVFFKENHKKISSIVQNIALELHTQEEKNELYR